MPHIAHHADDFAPLVVIAAERDAFADRVFVRKVTPLKRLVDNHHAGSLLFILLRKIAASDDRDFHCAEIAGADHVILHDRSLSRLLRQTAFDSEWSYAALPAQRQCMNRRYGFNSRKAVDALDELLIEADDLMRFRIPGFGQ